MNANTLAAARRDQRDPANQRLRELVAIARMLAHHTIERAHEFYDTRPATALVLLELARETEYAIERLRRA